MIFDEAIADMSQDIEMTTIEPNDSTFAQLYDLLRDPTFRMQHENLLQMFEGQPSTSHYSVIPSPPASSLSSHSSSLFPAPPSIHYNSIDPSYTLGNEDNGDYVTFILTVAPIAIEEAMEYLLVTPGLIGGIAYDDINYEGGSVPIVVEIKNDEDTLDDAVDYIQGTPLVEIVDAVPARWDCTDIHWVCTIIVCTHMLSYARLYLESVPGGYSGTSVETWKTPTARPGATFKIITKIHPWMLGRASDYCMRAPGRIAVTFRLEA